MRKILVVAVREYQAAVKTKAFILSIILMPIFMGGSIVVQKIMEDKVDTRDKRFVVLDQTALLYDTLAGESKRRNAEDIYSGIGDQRRQVKPRFLIEKAAVASDDPDQIKLELSQRVRDREIFGFVLIGPDALDADAGAGRGAIAYHSNSPTYDDFPRWVRGKLNDRIRKLRLAAAKLDPAIVEKATRYVPVANLGLVELDAKGGITEAKETNQIASMLVPLGMMMLMFMVVMIGAQPLMQTVLEEKIQRIAEVLLGSVSPFKLMMGKLLGTVGVSLTIATLYLVGAFIALHQTGLGQFFPTTLVWWFVVFQTMAVLMFGSMFVAIGAAVSDLKEAQSLMTPVMLLVIIPLLVWMPVVKEPMPTFSTVVSLFPPATPMLMLLRQAVPPGVPLWQPLLGIVLVLLTTTAVVFVSGRIFRVGILMQGQGARVGEMLRWAFRG